MRRDRILAEEFLGFRHSSKLVRRESHVNMRHITDAHATSLATTQEAAVDRVCTGLPSCMQINDDLNEFLAYIGILYSRGEL